MPNYYPADVMPLSVGGTMYTASRSTLTRFPNSILGEMFKGRPLTTQDDKGNYFIDGDGPLFRYVLNFLRRSILVLPEDFKELDMLAQEADFYQIKELIDAVTQIRNKVTIDREEEKRAKEHVKKQEFLEMEFSIDARNCPAWKIFCSYENLRKIPIKVNAQGYGSEEDGFPLPPLNRVNVFMQITQLGFKLVSVSSGRSDQARVDRWVFTRDKK